MSSLTLHTSDPPVGGPSRRVSSTSTVCETNPIRPTDFAKRNVNENGASKEQAIQATDEIALEPDDVLPVRPVDPPDRGGKVQYSEARRWFLLLVFSLASVSCHPFAFTLRYHLSPG